MRPTLRQLQYIVTVAETGRIVQAARELNVSQPSLSAQLSEVEEELGFPIFTRGRKGAKLTSAGEELVRRARALLHDHEELRHAVKGAGAFHGRLRLGVLPSIGPYLLPDVVKRIHQEHPQFRLVIREESTRDLDEGLRSGRLDLIISTPEDHPGTIQHHLFEERFWAALAQDHLLSETGGALDLMALSAQIFLTLGPSHRISHIVAALARRAGGRVSDEYEGTSLDAIRLMASTRAGVAILPHIYAAFEQQRGTNVVLRFLDDREARRDISLMQLHSHRLRPEVDDLAKILKEEAAKIMITLPPPQ
jgi:LysR family hydrogen peroxide-inducible transcriptional activator